MTLIRPATIEDVLDVSARMREADAEECLAGGLAPSRALYESWKTSIVSRSLVNPDTDAPVGITGVCPGFTPKWGMIWLLGTDDIAHKRMTFLRHSKAALALLYEESGKAAFYNYAYVGNTVHHQWLRWLGFTFINRHGAFYEFAHLRKGI